MTLKDLCQEANDSLGRYYVTFQIVIGEERPWDKFETVRSDSDLLVPFLDCQIIDLTAIGADVFRFELKGYEEKVDAFK